MNNPAPRAIAILSPSHGAGAGAEIVLEHLIGAWDSTAMPLCVVAPAGSRVREAARARGFAAPPLPAARDSLVSNLLALPEALRAAPPPRLVQAWGARSFELAWLAARRLNVPAVGGLHDHPLAAHHGAFRRGLMRLSANRLPALVCVSEALADACRRAGYRRNIAVIRNGLADSATPRVTSPRPRISFLGMRTPGKGFATIAPWIAATRDLDVEWRLYGEIAPELRRLASTLAAQQPGRVLLAGYAPADEAFARTDVLVHASTVFDALPTVLLEAARAGVPCVASSRGGAGEIVKDGVTGCLFDPGRPDPGLQRLLTLVADPSLRDRMGMAARRRFEAKFRVQAMADAYASFWAQRSPAIP